MKQIKKNITKCFRVESLNSLLRKTDTYANKIKCINKIKFASITYSIKLNANALKLHWKGVNRLW